MAGIGWSVDGVRIEVKSGFPFGKLVVGERITRLAHQGEWRVYLPGRDLVLRRQAKVFGFGVTQELLDGDIVIPPSEEHLEPLPAPPGAICAVHEDRRAKIACSRCGTFACLSCSRPAGVLCPTCFAKQSQHAMEGSAATAYLAPIPFFFLIAGIPGLMIAGLFGAAIYFLVQRTRKKWLRIAIACGLYGLALVVCVALAIAAIREQEGQSGP